MLEYEPERENQLAVKNRVVIAEYKCECDHEERCYHSGKQSQLENVPEQRTTRGTAPEKREDEGGHAKVGDGAENRIVGLQKPEVPVRGGTQVSRDKVLYEKRDSLDKEIHECDEYADFNIAERLEHCCKDNLYICTMGKLQGQSSFFVPGPPAKPGEAHKPIVDFLLKEIRGETVLDLGGGEGAYSLEMKKAGFDTTVADINEKSLAVAEQNGLKTKLLEPSEPLGENLADTVMMIEVLEHVPDPAEFLKSAIGAARKRVLFSLPCTNDFKTLFECGLSYAHVAVSDHLWHFSYDELKQLLDGLGVEYRLTMGDCLFPGAGIKLLRDCFSGPLGFLLMFPFRVLNKLGVIPKRYPSRFYGIIEKSDS